MSIVYYHTCDHCGKKLDDKKDYVEYDLNEFEYRSIDLCAGCYKELEETINKFLNREKGEK